MRYLWIKVTHDEYELPVAVADTARELARMCGVTVSTIWTTMSHVKDPNHRQKFSMYRKVEYLEDE